MVDMIPVKINGKYNIILPRHRAERPEYHTEAGWERARLDSMHNNLGKGDIVVYVGAEEGEMPALCQMWGAKVVLVEPNDKVWPNIKAIWKANKLDPPLETYVGFCSSENSDNYVSGRHGQGVWPECAEGEVIGDHGFKELQDPDNIPQIKIDTIPVIPTALCIDVEGSEWRVLEGALQSIKRNHPKIWLSIHPEFMFRIYGEYQYDLRRWIKDLGYKETILDYQHELHLFYEAIE